MKLVILWLLDIICNIRTILRVFDRKREKKD